MDFPRQHILAGTVLAGNQHGGICRCNLIQRFTDGRHGLGSSPEHRSFAALRMTSVRHAEAFGRSISPHCLPGLVPGGRECVHQFLIIPRLHNKVKRAALHALHRQGNIGISREQNHFHFRKHLLDFPGPVQAFVARIDAGVEVHIQQHHIRPEALQRTHQRHRRRQRFHLAEMHGQEDLQRLANPGVVVHNQYLSFLRCHRLQAKFSQLFPHSQYKRRAAECIFLIVR